MKYINNLPFLRHKFNSFLRSIMLEISHEDSYSIYTDYYIKKNCKKIYFSEKLVIVHEFSNSKYKFDKIYLRRNSSDLFVFNQVFIQKEYDTLFEIFKNNFKTNDSTINIIDLGGNIGLTSIYASMQFNKSNIIIVEPSIDNFEILVKNIDSVKNKNSLVNFTLFNNGIWEKACKLSIVNNKVDGWAIRVNEDKEGSINAISMNDLIKIMPEIDILKIDIEGSEYAILNDEVNCDWLNSVRVIAIEVHKKFGNVETISKIISSKGFIFCGKISETSIFLKS